MNVVDTAVVDQPITEADLEPDQPATLSITDHAKQFGPGAERAEPEKEVAEPLTPIRPVDQQKREAGKFAEGRKPMKAKDAVERINQLTGRAKTAEEGLVRANAELAQLRAERASPQQIAKAEAKVERAETRVEPPASGFTETEPDENDPKFGGDYGKYLRAAAAYDIRKEQFEAKQASEQQQRTQQRETAQRQLLTTWHGRVEAAKAKHADFEQVAFSATPIQEGSVADAFLIEDDNGPDVLYYLQQHPQERDEILRKSALAQVKALSLLSERFSSPTSSQAGTTGSAARRSQPMVLPPKPPNPVRTEAQRASDGPPPMDGSLSVMGHAKAFRRP